MASRSTPGALAMTDLPAYAREQLNLFGLNINTSLLAGADLPRLDRLREAADKASCPCLVLVEDATLPFADSDDEKGDAAIARMKRVVHAANRLGCNAAAVGIGGDDNPDAIEFAADRIKRVLQGAERMEVNLLLMARPGLTATPEKLTDLIKKIGGFRIGTFPDFQTASQSGDATHFLRRLTPYASAVTASSLAFKESKKPPGVAHDPYDLMEYVATIESVGYQGTLAIDFRGETDPEQGVKSTRDLLAWALGERPEEPEPEDLLELIAAVGVDDTEESDDAEDEDDADDDEKETDEKDGEADE